MCYAALSLTTPYKNAARITVMNTHQWMQIKRAIVNTSLIDKLDEVDSILSRAYTALCSYYYELGYFPKLNLFGICRAIALFDPKLGSMDILYAVTQLASKTEEQPLLCEEDFFFTPSDHFGMLLTKTDLNHTMAQAIASNN